VAENLKEMFSAQASILLDMASLIWNTNTGIAEMSVHRLYAV